MKKSKSLYHGHRFPAEVISCAVRWYFRFQLSLRDIEELLFERGVTVTYETIRCWWAISSARASLTGSKRHDLHSAGRGHNLARISLAVGRAKCASGPPGSLSN